MCCCCSCCCWHSRSRPKHICAMLPCNGMPVLYTASCQVRVQCCDVISSVPLVFTPLSFPCLLVQHLRLLQPMEHAWLPAAFPGQWAGGQGPRAVPSVHHAAIPASTICEGSPRCSVHFSVGPCSVNVWVKSVWITSFLFWVFYAFLFVCLLVLLFSVTVVLGSLTSAPWCRAMAWQRCALPDVK